MGNSQVNAGTCGLCALVSVLGLGRADAQIEWRTGAAELAPQSMAAVGEAIAALDAGDAHGVVRFERALAPAERSALEAAGMKLLAPLGSNAYFVSFDDAQAGEIVGAGPVASVQSIQLSWKLHPMLAAGEAPTWATVGSTGGDPIVAVYIVYHRDVNLMDATLDLPAFAGKTVDLIETINGAVVEMPFSLIDDLASTDDVQWIEPALPMMTETNAENRAITQVNDLQAAPYGLDGTDVTAFVFDGGKALAGHSDFSGRLTVFQDDESGIANHATHVSGTVGGDGSINFNNRGMAPNVSLLSAGLEWFGGGIFLYTNPGDIEKDYAWAISMDANTANNSIGTNTETNGFPCAIQGDYGVTSSVIDAIVRGSLGEPLIVVWANGNERQGSSCDIEGYGDYYSTAPPAGAKNHITVGALNANNDTMTSFSSWGPVDDGRMKPDISAPGCQQGGDGGVTSCSSGGGYSVSCGTSMASPTVCGITALILQDYRAQFPGNDDPLAATMKVFLAHTAHDLGNVGPDYQFGYGSVRAKDAIDFMRAGEFAEQQLWQGELHAYKVDVAGGAPEIRVTLAWDDAPGTPNVNPALVNQLDVRLIDPIGGVHHPWTLDPFNPGAPATQNQANTRDNIEQVYVANPMAGEWTLVVEGTNVAEGPQTYSVGATPNLTEAILSIGLVNGVPTLVAPGTPHEVVASITAINDSLVPGSEKLFYRFGDGAFSEVPFVKDGETYAAFIPGAACNVTPQFYLSAEGAANGVALNPSGGPASAYAYGIGEIVTIVEDEAEVPTGWTMGVQGDTATTGQWAHGNPVGTDAQPEDDHTPTGVNCFFTGQGQQGGGLGDNDVDNGFTTLISPVYDVSDAPEAEMSYWRWFSNDTGAGPNSDPFVIDISDDGGNSWTNLEVVGPGGPGTSGGWIQHTFKVADFVEPTAQIRLRFIAEDDPADGQGSLVEAAIDDVKVETLVCESGCYADFNGDGSLNILDFVAFQGAFVGADPSADCDANGALNILDFVCFQGMFAKGCP